MNGHDFIYEYLNLNFMKLLYSIKYYFLSFSNYCSQVLEKWSGLDLGQRSWFADVSSKGEKWSQNRKKDSETCLSLWNYKGFVWQNNRFHICVWWLQSYSVILLCPLLSSLLVLLVCSWLSVFWLLCFKFRFYKREKTWYIYFWFCLILLNMMISSSIHFPANIILPSSWIILYSRFIPWLLYSLTHC
jgi:hypothetical protein